MKSFLVSALFVALLGLAFGAAIENTSDSSEEIKEWKLASIKKYLNESGHLEEVTDILEKWCTGSSEKLGTALDELIECDNAIDDSVTTCDSVRLHALKCTTPLIKVVSECLPEHSRDFPKLAVKSMISAFDYLCKQDGEHIFELGNTCFFGNESEDPKVLACKQKVYAQAEAWQEDLPSKTEACNTGKEVRACLQIHISQVCANEKTRSANLGLADALLAPCNAS